MDVPQLEQWCQVIDCDVLYRSCSGWPICKSFYAHLNCNAYIVTNSPAAPDRLPRSTRNHMSYVLTGRRSGGPLVCGSMMRLNARGMYLLMRPKPAQNRSTAVATHKRGFFGSQMIECFTGPEVNSLSVSERSHAGEEGIYVLRDSDGTSSHSTA